MDKEASVMHARYGGFFAVLNTMCGLDHYRSRFGLICQRLHRLMTFGEEAQLKMTALHVLNKMSYMHMHVCM